MVDNIIKWIFSSIIWIILIIFFDKGMVWKIALVAAALSFIKFCIDLYLQSELQEEYGLKLSSALEDRVKSVIFVSPPIIIFIIIWLIAGQTVITAPGWKEAIITFSIGVWFAYIECFLLSTAFMRQVIESTLR